MSTHSGSDVSTDCSEDFGDDLIRELDSDLVYSLALTIRSRAPIVPNSQNLTCSVAGTPRQGGFNVVYEVEFSDGVSWAVHIPCRSWNVKRERTMQLDMVGLQYVSESRPHFPARPSNPRLRLHDEQCPGPSVTPTWSRITSTGIGSSMSGMNRPGGLASIAT